jgi:HEAT repeat protein
MTAPEAIAAAVLLLGACWSGGCKGQDQNWTLNKFVHNLAAPPNKVDWVDDPDPDKRREAITAMSSDPRYLHEPHTKFYALALTSDGDDLVRAAAARALGLAGDPTYLPQLLAGLEDRSPVVRRDAAWALDKVPDDSAVGPLAKHAATDPSPDVRAACCGALGHYSLPQVDATLVSALRDPDLNVRRRARATLARLTGIDLGDSAADWSDYLKDQAQAPR